MRGQGHLESGLRSAAPPSRWLQCTQSPRTRRDMSTLMVFVWKSFCKRSTIGFTVTVSCRVLRIFISCNCDSKKKQPRASASCPLEPQGRAWEESLTIRPTRLPQMVYENTLCFTRVRPHRPFCKTSRFDPTCPSFSIGQGTSTTSIFQAQRSCNLCTPFQGVPEILDLQAPSSQSIEEEFGWWASIFSQRCHSSGYCGK